MSHPGQVIDDVRRVARRGQGSHLCHFYRKEEEVLELLPPFFADGLAEGQLCIWVLPSWLTIQRAVTALTKAGPRVERALEDDTLELVPQSEVYGNPQGRFRGVQYVIDHWLAEERRALDRGFLGLRVSGDGTWQTCGEDGDAFHTYERTVNEAIGATKITAVCTYDFWSLTPHQISQTLGAHQTGLCRGPEGWQQFGCATEEALVQRLTSLMRGS